jgi:hypothetical protein
MFEKIVFSGEARVRNPTPFRTVFSNHDGTV